MAFAVALFSPILYLIFSALWAVFISLPFLILNGIFNAIKFFGFEFFQIIAFGTSDPTKLGVNAVPAAFLGAVIISIALLVIAFLIVIIKYQFSGKESKEGQISIKSSVRAVLPAIAIIVLIPLILFFFNLLMTVGFDLINRALTLDDSKNNLSVIQKMYEELNAEFPSIKGHLESNGNFYGPNFGEWFNWAVSSPIELGVKFVVNMIVGWGSLFIIGGIAISVVVKSFHLLFLFIISPFVAAHSIADGGKNIHKWKEIYIQKNLGMLTQIASLQFYLIFIIAIGKYFKTGLNNVDFGTKILLQLIVYLGAAAAIKSLSKIIIGFVGETVEDGDAKDAFGALKNGFKFANGLVKFGAGVAVGGLAGGAAKTILGGAAKGGISGLAKGLGRAGINKAGQGINKMRARKSGMSTEAANNFANAGENKGNAQAQNQNLKALKKQASFEGDQTKQQQSWMEYATSSPDNYRKATNARVETMNKAISDKRAEIEQLSSANKNDAMINEQIKVKMKELNNLENDRHKYVVEAKKIAKSLEWDTIDFLARHTK
ncbi:Mbov_0396 family ICE element transmembrane protein [Mycoplasma sp. 125]|uniref:Mbov_0396 family ICE element transmembrane protein n=1 Tax=Mycoplasma sp. 125 TaxID=3447505 RepID=UPI003F655F2E